MILPAFVGPAYASQSPVAANEVCINWYPEDMETAGEKAPRVEYPCPGFSTFINLGPDAVRGMFSVNGRTFAVAGETLWELDVYNVTKTNRGTVAVDGNPATFASNGDGGFQVFLTSGDHGYCYDLNTNTLTQVFSSGCAQCAFLDGYFLRLDATEAKLYVSDLENGLVWNPTQVAQRSQAPDRWVSMTVIHGDIWLQGSQTSEVWYNAGTAPFPFAPRPGAFIQQGTCAAFSTSNTSPLIWLSQNDQGAGMVHLADGYTATRVSTYAVEQAIQQYATLADAIAWTYQQNGHFFYVLTFPSAKATWVYDPGAKVWHQRGYYDRVRGQWDAQRVGCHVNPTSTLHLAGSRYDGTVYRMDPTIATDTDGQGMVRTRRFPGLWDENKNIRYGELRVTMQTGIGVSSGQGSDPQVMLKASNDSGQTWGNQVWASAGAIGATQTRVRFLRQGMGRQRVWELSVSDPVTPWALVSAEVLNVSEGIL